MSNLVNAIYSYLPDFSLNSENPWLDDGTVSSLTTVATLAIGAFGLHLLISNSHPLKDAIRVKIEAPTSLHCAALAGNIEAIRTSRLDPDIARKGATPLHYAVYGAEADAVRALLEKRADPNKKDNNGHTPLHAALFGKNRDVIMALLEHPNIDPYAKINDYISFIDFIRYKYREVSEASEESVNLFEYFITIKSLIIQKQAALAFAWEQKQEQENSSDEKASPDLGALPPEIMDNINQHLLSR